MKVCPEFDSIRNNLPGPKKMKWAPRFHTCDRPTSTSTAHPFYCCERMTVFVQQTTGTIISPLFNSHQLKERSVNLIDDYIMVTAIELAFNDQTFWNFAENPRREPRVPVCTFDGQPLEKFTRKVNNARSQISIAWTNLEGMKTCAKYGWEPYTGPKDIFESQAAVQAACDHYNGLICRFLLAAVEYRARTPYRFLNASPRLWQLQHIDRDTNISLRSSNLPEAGLEPNRLIRIVDETGAIVPVIKPPQPNRAEIGNGIGIALRHENHVFFNSEQLWAHACDQFTDSDTESETESDDEEMEF